MNVPINGFESLSWRSPRFKVSKHFSSHKVGITKYYRPSTVGRYNHLQEGITKYYCPSTKGYNEIFVRPQSEKTNYRPFTKWENKILSLA